MQESSTASPSKQIVVLQFGWLALVYRTVLSGVVSTCIQLWFVRKWFQNLTLLFHWTNRISPRKVIIIPHLRLVLSVILSAFRNVRLNVLKSIFGQTGELLLTGGGRVLVFGSLLLLSDFRGVLSKLVGHDIVLRHLVRMNHPLAPKLNHNQPFSMVTYLRKWSNHYFWNIIRIIF